ncbi:MAG: deoxyribose-phosphate aldolase [bacterium]|nr:deoxyribose-phosphate aldolase [bacterium]
MTDDKILCDLNRRFDHAALAPETDESAVRLACDEAIRLGFFSVVVNPVWTSLVADLLTGSQVEVLGVAGFPLGASRTNIKAAEASNGVADGAHEIDIVANIGHLVSGQFLKVEQEISTIRRALPYNVALKVIIEASKLTAQQQIDATRAVAHGGAQFVKTGTGFFGGATVEQVGTLYKAAAGEIEVKASGGIKTLAQCRELLSAGATRLGASASVSIMAELTKTEGGH